MTDIVLSNSLTALADEVAAAHAEFEVASRRAFDRALITGSLLLDAKGGCVHGEWLPFLARAGVVERQAQRLMSLSRAGLVPDFVSDIGGLGAALKFVSQWHLPVDDEAVVIAFDDDDLKGPYRKSECGSAAVVYRSPVFETPVGFYHVGGYDIPDATYAAQVVSIKPWPGEVIRGQDGIRFSMVLMAIQQIMGPLLAQSSVTTMRRAALDAGFIASFEHQRVDARAERGLPAEAVMAPP